MMMVKKFLLLVFQTLASVYFVDASCPIVCECPTAPLVCPAGVSLVADGCGCCKVCAAQLNQDCNTGIPCDSYKGLECNYGNDVTFGSGVCRAKLEGHSCEFNGEIFQNGESFRVGCKHQCTCINGAVGCGPLCTTNLPPASPSCPHPRLVRVPGQCCFSVDCHKGAIGPVDLNWKKKHLPNSQLDKKKYTLGKELLTRKKGWEDELKNNHLPGWTHNVHKRCVVQTTEWSPCSSSCGMGLSSRTTNENAQCKLERETRLCNIRPCKPLAKRPKKGKKCTRMYKSSKPIHLSYADCRTLSAYQLNYCGGCTDGRCCVPRHTTTISVRFHCPGGWRLDKAVMFILSCKCGQDCEHLNETAMLPQKWRYGDTHKFND